MPSSPDRVPDLPGTRLLSSVGREGRKALDCLALNPDRAVLVIASHGVLYRFGGRPHASEPNRRWMEPLRRLRTVLRAICYLDSHDLAVLNAQGLPGLRPDEELRFDAVTEGGLAAYVNGDHQEWPVPDPPELREQVKQLLRRLELAESVQLIEVPPRCVRVHRVNSLGNDELWNLQGELRGAGEDEGSDVRAGRDFIEVGARPSGETAVHRYLLEVGGVGTVVFVGHFLRDLSAFPALDRLRTWGIPALKVGVGTSIPYPDSEADLWLKDLKDVPLLLEELYSLTGRYGTA